MNNNVNNKNNKKMITELNDRQIDNLLVYTPPYTEQNAENIKKLALDKIKPKRKTGSFRLKPVLVSAMLVIMLTTTAAAAAPFILKMFGSDIGFFESDKQTRYSADYELIKKYSSEVGITAEGDGFSFTVDNIAYDGTFMSIFYTINKEANIREEIQEQSKKRSSVSEWMLSNDKFFTWEALFQNEIYMEIPGYIERPDYENNSDELMNYTLGFPIRDGYLVSDYELKGMQRYTITEDLPDIFDIEISYKNGKYFADYLARLKISLTVDISESKIETLVVTPNISAVTTQININGIEGLQHDITIDRVSISPLGNILMFTEKGGSNELNGELFSNYFIVDDKGNVYGKAKDDVYSRKDWGIDASVMLEFYGDVPADAQYLKLLPYNARKIPEVVLSDSGEPKYMGDPEDKKYYMSLLDPREFYLESKAYINDLPQSLLQNEYGNVIIESCTVTEKDITVTYKYDGMVIPPFLVITDGKESVSPYGQIGTYDGFGSPAYSRSTDSYTRVFTFTRPIGNAQDLVKGITAVQYDVELLEEQAIIIPLR